MRLKRLELYGYKSFASRATFDFGDGVTAIVGPNGSGKSNVADGVRWVLGEQSYSNLRGRRTEDMIFAGARRRSRLGMAEVTLTLDNVDGWLNIDFTEVTIGRRAYRSGENEYLLNGSRVRYRDIAELLGASGLAASNYVVIGQGLVDAALSLTPEARRSLFEEAAGIAPQLRKRQDTLDRIQETQRNLDRVEDIINELRPRGRTLRRQAERAEEHMLLRQDLRELQRIWYGFQWQTVQQKQSQAEMHLNAAREHLEGQRAYSKQVQATQAAIKEQLAREQKGIESLTDRLSALRDESAELSRELAVSTERARLYAQQIESTGQDRAAQQSRRSVLEDEVARSSARVAEHEMARKTDLEQIAILGGRLRELDAQRATMLQQARTLERQIAEGERSLVQRQAQIEQLSERHRELDAERDEANARAVRVMQQLTDMHRLASELEVQEQRLAGAQETIERTQQDEEAQLLAAREELASLEQVATEARSERDQWLGRQRSMQRLREQMGDYHPGVREVLRAAERLGGIRGTVASLMRVPKAYEQAIQSALGSRLENIVTERWENAEAAIALLKERQAGWATFLPLDTLQARPALQPRQTTGIVGVASDLVQYAPDLKPVYELLLGHVLIVEDLASARRLLRERTGASLLVTLGGETAQPSGAVSGGARQTQTRLLAQEREWRELPARLRAAEEKHSEALSVVTAFREHIGQLQGALRQRALDITHSRREREAAHQALRKHGDQVNQMERERAWLSARHEQIEQEQTRLAERTLAIKDEVDALRTQGEDLATQLSGTRAGAEALEDRELREKVTALETEAEVAARIDQSLHTLLQSHQRNLEQIDAQIDAQTAQQHDLERRLQEVTAKVALDNARLEALEARMQEVRESLEPARERRIALDREVQRIDEQHAASLDRLHEAETEYNQATLERDRARDQQNNLSAEIEDSLGPIDLPDVVAHQLRLNLDDDVVELPRVLVLPQGLSEEIRQLRARLRRVGSVNPEAPREFEKLLERQTFLQGQVSDLRGAIASLQEVIEELDQVIEQDFSATIARVDKGFAAYFEELFGGGTARLVLTDPANMATTGVDIIAHPPGKHAQRLSLLSGGERALTAVALLFALLSANPVPFCFLDEVDAALDESNVARFRDMLRRHGQSMQFVVITHNRRTIEAAGTIYGISMEDQGVSQCISLQVEEAVDVS